jgi:hypothetical protein
MRVQLDAVSKRAGDTERMKKKQKAKCEKTMQAQGAVVVSGSDDDSSSDSEAGADIGAEDSPDSSDSHQQSPLRVDRKLGSEEVEEEDPLESMDQQQLPTSAKRKKKKKSKESRPKLSPTPWPDWASSMPSTREPTPMPTRWSACTALSTER